ncbi:MAG: DNA polymerase I, partial [Clostridia bacterium]|nr:DNA polymerase I [Clostridia bacterium]
MDKEEKLVLIDGNSLINRAFYALPLLKNSDGEYSNAVYGFCNILIKLIESQKPKYFAVAFDMGHQTFRHQIYDGYKAGRKKMPEELAAQIPVLKSVLSAMNIKYLEEKDIEADDIIGTLAKKINIPTIIVSGDRDLFQLVDDTTSIWFTKKGISDAVVITPQNIKEVYGVEANQVADLKGIMGDASDNIKGVAGIGEVGAKKLINQYGSVEGIYEHIDEQKGVLQQKLK